MTDSVLEVQSILDIYIRLIQFMMSALERFPFPNQCLLAPFENTIYLSKQNAPHGFVMRLWSWKSGQDLRDTKKLSLSQKYAFLDPTTHYVEHRPDFSSIKRWRISGLALDQLNQRLHLIRSPGESSVHSSLRKT